MASKKIKGAKAKKSVVIKDDTAWFKLFCKQNRLRFCMSEDNWPIAKSIGKWSEDQFYEGFGEGIVGIHVRRDTKMQYTHLKKRLIKNLTTMELLIMKVGSGPRRTLKVGLMSTFSLAVTQNFWLTL